MRTLMQKELKDQKRYQEMEILLSYDFSKMNLEELKNISEEYINLQKQGETLHWNSDQYKAWQFMYYCIKKEENKNDSAKIGDIFHSSWGYDQTNTEFYKIISISPSRKTCKVVQIKSESIGDEAQNNRNMSASIIPDPDNIIDTREQRVKIERSYDKNPYTEKADSIGEIQLRGSVFIGVDENSSQHLTTLTRVKGECSRSWYA